MTTPIDLEKVKIRYETFLNKAPNRSFELIRLVLRLIQVIEVQKEGLEKADGMKQEIKALINVHATALSKDFGNSNIESVYYRIKEYDKVRSKADQILKGESSSVESRDVL